MWKPAGVALVGLEALGQSAAGLFDAMGGANDLWLRLRRSASGQKEDENQAYGGHISLGPRFDRRDRLEDVFRRIGLRAAAAV